ncbi:MAG: hypothetical protein RLZZ399_757 [Verrucomicrobiota bacterium]
MAFGFLILGCAPMLESDACGVLMRRPDEIGRKASLCVGEDLIEKGSVSGGNRTRISGLGNHRSIH